MASLESYTLPRNGDATLLRHALGLMKRTGERYTSSPLPEWDVFAATVHLLRFPKGVQVPHGSHDVSLVLSGGVKLIFEDEDLKGEVAEFFFPGSIMTSTLRPRWDGMLAAPFPVAQYVVPRSRTPVTSAHTLTRTELLRFDYRVIEQLAARHAQWGEAHSAVLWMYIEAILANVNTLRSGNASRQYELLMQRVGVDGLLTQAEIASYLGISRETLNRIIKGKQAREGATAIVEERQGADT